MLLGGASSGLMPQQQSTPLSEPSLQLAAVHHTNSHHC